MYYRDVITCVSHFNAETQVRLDYINICLSYPYIKIDGDNEKRRYILFYRWIHWSLLMLAGFYYIPRKVSKSLENARAKKLMEDIAANSFRYDNIEKELVERAARFVTSNLKTHNGLYFNFLCVNIIALIIDLLTFQYLNFIFQGRFMSYGFSAYPFDRDPRNFNDYMSQMFPPFVSCELTSENKLTNKRTEELGCHLTIMELYEKIFLALWLWLILLTALTAGYILFLIAMLFPAVRKQLLRTAKPISANDKVSKTIVRVSDNCKVGDMYILYRLKQHFSHARFYELLSKLSDPELCKIVVQSSEREKLEKLAAQKQHQLDSLRNRKPIQQDPPLNPEYLHLLNPDMPRQPQGNPAFPGNKSIPGQPGIMMSPEMQQRAPLINNKKNTSILIE